MRQRILRCLRRSPLGARAVAWQRVLAAPWQCALRRAAIAGLDGAPAIRVPPSSGYARFSAADLPLGGEVLARSGEVLERTAASLSRIHARQHGRYGIVFDLLSDDRLLAWPCFVDFALSPPMLASATRYLGTLPVLHRVALALSRHRADLTSPRGSQLYHLDREDTTQLKAYVTVSAVGTDDGPLHFLSAETSARVLAGLRHDARRRPLAHDDGLTFTDEEVLRHCAPSEVQRLEGPPGTGLLLDTSRCLHFGSRMRPGASRLIVYVVYQRYACSDPTPQNAFDRARYRGDRLRSLVLTPPRERPFGWYFPNPVLAPGPSARGDAELAFR